MDALSHLQWPAMAVTVAASWLVGSTHERRRKAGFWLFLLSNLMWTVWGVHDHAPALIALQVALAAMNIRGARKAAAALPENRPAGAKPPSANAATGRRREQGR